MKSIIRMMPSILNISYNIESAIRVFPRQTDIQQQCQILFSYSHAKLVPRGTFAPLYRYLYNVQWITETKPGSMKGPVKREIVDDGCFAQFACDLCR